MGDPLVQVGLGTMAVLQDHGALGFGIENLGRLLRFRPRGSMKQPASVPSVQPLAGGDKFRVRTLPAPQFAGDGSRRQMASVKSPARYASVGTPGGLGSLRVHYCGNSSKFQKKKVLLVPL